MKVESNTYIYDIKFNYTYYTYWLLPTLLMHLKLFSVMIHSKIKKFISLE